MSLRKWADWAFLPLLALVVLLLVGHWQLTPDPELRSIDDTDWEWPETTHWTEEEEKAAAADYSDAYAPVAEGWRVKDLRAGVASLALSLSALLLLTGCRRFSDLARVPALPWRWLYLPMMLGVVTALPCAAMSTIYRDWERGAFLPWADSLGIPATGMVVLSVMLLPPAVLLALLPPMLVAKGRSAHLWQWDHNNPGKSVLAAGVTGLLLGLMAVVTASTVVTGAVWMQPVLVAACYLFLSGRALLSAGPPS